MDNYVEAEEVTNSLSTNSPNKTYNEIAKKLLNEKLLLTALELHAELCESGKELPVLRDFFSNANNFEAQNMKPEPFISMPRSSSQVTLDSLDMTRYSEDGGTDERVAILEFELRKARENITALRENLTVVAESDSIIATDKINDRSAHTEVPIKPHEQRALNFLVYEYLLARLYKLTSITFSDENENQDFENWDDVGLNTPKPPDLLQIYRERGNGYEKPSSHEIGIQTNFDENDVQSSEIEENSKKYLIDELEALKNQVLSLEQTKLDLENRLDTIGTLETSQITKVTSQKNQPLSSNSTTPDKFEILETPEDDSISLIASVGDTDPGDKDWTKVQLLHRDVTIEMPTLLNSPSRSLPFKLKREILSHCLTTSPMVDGLHESLIDIVTLSLPKIIPNIVANKRDESIPLILNAIRFNESASEREKLLQLLFNLKKKPQEEDRRLILGGLIGIVKNDDTPPYPDEIMTVCWEHSQHKYPERRILAAECCTNLAPFTSSDIRNSLMLSMLQQMLLDDKDPSVKLSVIKSLSLLVALMDDPEKYFQCEELALTALDDNNTEVFEQTSNLLFPILAQWALSLNRFESHLLPRILKKLKRQLIPAQQSPNKNYHRDSEKFFFTITVLQLLLPHTIVFIVNNPIVKSKIQESTSSEIPRNISSLCRSSITNPQIFFEENEDIGILLNTFLNTSWNDEASWKNFDWLSDKLIPDILEMIKSIDIHQENILNPLLNYIQCLCTGFGKFVTQERIKKMFSNEIKELENELMNLSSDKVPSINLTLIPAYLTVLSTIDSLEMSKTLKHFIVLLSISNYDSSCLVITVKRLVKNSQLVESVVIPLWDITIHQRPIVRTTAAKLFSEIIQIVNERLVTSRIAPAIVTLASDTDLMVKSEAIYALGKLITECGAREAKDKGRLTLETIVKESQEIPSVLLIPIVTTLANIAPSCPQHFVEDFIVTQLAVICNKIDSLQQNRRLDLTGVLLDAYSILVYCSLSDKCVLLPGLRYLENLVSQLVPQKKEIVKSLIREAESKQNIMKTIERSTSASSGLSLSLATANVGQGVEDMRQRMSKIFTQKSNSLVFRKK